MCNIPSGCCFFTGPCTVTRSSLCMLGQVAAFCRPLRPVFLLVSFPHSRSPEIDVLGLCWLVRGSCLGFCCPLPSAFWSSTTCLAVFPWACGPSGCCSLWGPAQSPVLPFACCVGSLCSDGRCGLCSLWCRFRVCRAQWLGLCWLVGGSFYGFCCPLPSALKPSTTRFAAFLCACGPTLPPLHAASWCSTMCLPATLACDWGE